MYKNSQEPKGLTNKKLQKLLYYAQAWSVTLRNKAIFQDDIEAWVHGPAIPVIYQAYKDFGHDEINVQVDSKKFDVLDIQERELLDSVWQVYGKYDGNYLELLTHSEDPWQLARKDKPGHESSDSVISFTSMKDYYGEKLKKAKART